MVMGLLPSPHKTEDNTYVAHMHITLAHIYINIYTHTLNTRAHTYMLACTSTSDSLVCNKMVVRMATARSRTTTNSSA